jgi:cytochrome c5
MKNHYLFLGVVVIILISTSSVLSPEMSIDEKSTTPVNASSIPDDLKVIFKNSCMVCHATGGKGMAMAKLNFSEWDNYAPDKQTKKAEAICKIVSKEAMPPKSFRTSYPEAVPTASQKDLICKWSAALAPKE